MSEAKKFSYRKTPAYERMKRFLGSYISCKKAYEAYDNEKECDLVSGMEKEFRDAFYDECRQRCKDIEAFIYSVNADKEERELLILHYIVGMSIENASEKLYVSRSTAFRINDRAEYKALLRYIALEGGGRNIS